MGDGLGTVIQHIRKLAGCQAAEDLTDRQLLEHFSLQRDETAFSALLVRHGALVWNVCRRVLDNDHDAEDVFQATFLILARKAPSIRKLGSWLHKIALLGAMELKRKAARRRAHEKQAIMRTQPKPQSDLAMRELLAVLDEEVQRLPANLREPFVLCCLEGRSKAEAARQLGWPEGTVSGRLAQARKRVQQRLTRRGITLSAGLTAAVLTMSAARVPGALIEGTVRQVFLLAAREAAGMGQVAALAEAVMKGMAAAKVKAWLMVALVAILIAAGIGLAAYEILPQTKTPSALENAPITAAKADERPHGPEGRQAHTDLHGDPLPAGAVARLGTVRWRHGYLISSVVFSPNGKTLVSAGFDSIIRVWNADSGKELRRLTGHHDGVYSVALSSDGKTLVSGGEDKTVRLWEWATGKELRQLVGHDGPVLTVAISPDGKAVASGGMDKTVRLWSAFDGKPVHRLVAHKLDIASLAFSPDGKILASASAPWDRIVQAEEQDSKIRLWSVATGEEIGQLIGHTQGICAVAFSSDSKMLVSAGDYHALGDRTIRLWDVAKRAEVQRWEPKELESFHSLALSSDGKTLATGVSAQLQNPNLAQGLADMEYKIRLWNMRTGKVLREIPAGDARCMAFSPGGKTLALLSADRTLQIWDLAAQNPIGNLKGHQANVMSVAFSLDGKTLASAGMDKTIRLWDVTNARQIGELYGHKQAIQSLALSPDSKTLASGSYDHTFRLWDLARGKEIDCDFQAQEVFGVGFSPDGKLVASAGTGGGFFLKEFGAEMKLRTRSRADVALVSLAWTPDGKIIATGSGDGRILLWDGTAGTKLREWKGHQNTVRSLAFSPDSKMLASASEDRQIALWEMSSSKQRRRLQHPHTVSCVAFSPTGDLLVSGSENIKDKTIHVWDLAKDAELVQLTGHQAGVNSLSFSPDGSRLASGSSDTTILLWDVAALRKTKEPQVIRLSTEKLNIAWQDLASEDALKAYSAMWALASAGEQAVYLLKERMRPVEPADPQHVAKLIANLGNSEFTAREKATVELEELGDSAAKPLQQAIENKPSPEVHRRLQSLLECLHGPIQSPRLLQALRAIETLEHIGTADAKSLLDSLAHGIPESRQTQEAKRALKRLDK